MIGDDIGGIAVHIGARVAALAGASEVLVSGTVKDLVAGSGLRFGDRGNHSLKGVPGRLAHLCSRKVNAPLNQFDLTLIRSLRAHQMSLAGQNAKYSESVDNFRFTL